MRAAGPGPKRTARGLGAARRGSENGVEPSSVVALLLVFYFAGVVPTVIVGLGCVAWVALAWKKAAAR